MSIFYETNINTCELVTFDEEEYNEALECIKIANESLSETNVSFMKATKSHPSLTIKRPDEMFHLPLKKNLFGVYVLEIELGGKVRKLIIDTGAQASALTSEVVKDLRLTIEEEQVEVGSASGKVVHMGVALLPKLKIGPLLYENVSLLVLNNKQLNVKLLNIPLAKFDGIIGWDLLHLIDFSIDNKNRLFTYHLPQISTDYSNLIPSYFPTVLMKNQKERLMIIGIDTGARQSWINEDIIDPFQLKVKKTIHRRIHGIHGKEVLKLKVIPTFTIKMHQTQISFKNIQTGFTGFLLDFEFDAIIGSEILENHTMYFLNSIGRIQILDSK